MLLKLIRKYGFDDCRVIDASYLSAPKKFLEEWLKKRNHGQMHYLDKDLQRRLDPSVLLPKAKSLLILSKNYFIKKEKSLKKASLARFACFEDYHKVIGKNLKLLCQELKKIFPEDNFKFYVDHGPLMEKAFALKSGLGFIGKNTTLITEKFGSWVLLAEIISTVDPKKLILREKKRKYENCGTCTNCLKSCPTGALKSPYLMDARKCISYLTIEYKGIIPINLRDKIKNNLFGCDLCQEACPFNQKRQKSTLWKPIFSPQISLQKILALRSDEEFRKLFAKSPMKRAKFSGLIRNACVVAGNTGDKEFLPDLLFWEKNGDDVIKPHASWAIKKIKSN